jgi:hypothetical protein
LFHWDDREARERLARLRAAGFVATHVAEGANPRLRPVRADPPDAVVIDLSRVPSRGRDVGLALRTFKDTRRVPLLFVGGDPERTAAVGRLLPDATFTTWARIGPALRRACRRAVADPVKPPSLLAGYSGTPLPRKLGVKPGTVVALAGAAPDGFEATLGPLPDGGIVRRRTWGGPALTVWFVRSRAQLDRGLPRMLARAAGGNLWIAWPKKASGVATDLSEAVVRTTGLAAGLVDFKICALDATWSGLRFTRRARRPKGELP